MTNKALFVIDMLNDFVQEGAPLSTPGAKEIVPNIQREIHKAHEENYPVFFLCDNHSPDDPELIHWPQHAMQGTEGAQIIGELAPSDQDIVIRKTRYDAFLFTDLEQQLNKRNIQELILTGVTTEICIHYTGAAAVMRGYRVEVPEDCVKGLFEDTSNAALKMLKEVIQPQKS